MDPLAPRSHAEQVTCWLRYLRIFAMQTPFGLPVKITVGVSEYDGMKLAEILKVVPYDVVDARGRQARQVETEDHLIAVEWLVSKPPEPLTNPVTWGGTTAYGKR